MSIRLAGETFRGLTKEFIKENTNENTSSYHWLGLCQPGRK